MTKTPYGIITAPSTSTELIVTAYRNRNSTPIIGQTVYTDQTLDDGYEYRSVGTVADVTTTNPNVAQGNPILASIARSSEQPNHDLTNVAGGHRDEKRFTMRIQATYRRRVGTSGSWEQVGTGLLSSAETNTGVYILDHEALQDILGERVNQCSYIGTFRGMSGANMPLTIGGFNTRRGATHQAIVGRSGSGKTAKSHQLLGATMRNESHAIIVFDPQGQWANESGFLWSLQKFAKNLGREVTVLRVSEDIRLPLEVELLANIMNELKLWKALQRMGAENAEALSEEVAKLVVRHVKDNPNENPGDTPRNALLTAFSTIALNDDIIARIYARTGEAGGALKLLMGAMSDVPTMVDRDGDAVEYTPEQLASAAESFNSVLTKFTPLINLFLKENLNGEPRTPLGGYGGFLSTVLRARTESEVAPYVILDMSSDVKLHARTNYANSVDRVTGEDNSDAARTMKVMLDNADIKARIMSTVLDAVVRQAELSFAEGEGNLDTQIVFDEAWRYAPNPNTVTRGSAVHRITERLAGYALDTRKYGVGWTYILQSPGDLNPTIWRQLTYVWAGYGMLSGDKRMIEELMDDRAQMRLYDGFSDPGATGVYPFMVTGPVNPLIFTAAPSFMNVFSTAEEFLSANQSWIDEITERRSVPRVRAESMTGKPPVAGHPVAQSKGVTAVRKARKAVTDRGVGEVGVPAVEVVDDDSIMPF